MQEGSLVEILLNLTGGADTVVLWLLIGLSIWATAIIIDRVVVFRRTLPPIESALEQVRSGLVAADRPGDWVPDQAGELGGLFVDVWNTGGQDAAVQAQIRNAAGNLRRMLMNRASVLGTLGANAPFIGLLGTVFGIMQAFRDLAAAGGGNPNAVMGGIAEALVATGMGLLVAIPCVLAFNYFSRRASQVRDEIEEIGGWLAAARER